MNVRSIPFLGLVAIIACTSTTSTDEVLIEGLRVEAITSAAAMFMFETDRELMAGAEWGTAMDRLDQVTEESTSSISHAIRLADLVPGTAYFVRARITDEAGETHVSAVMSFMSASAEPTSIFRNLRVEEVGSGRAVVRFDTTVPTTCEVEWGMASDRLPNTATDPNMVEGELALEHEVPLEDLAPDAMHFFRAKATDADELTLRSEVLSFRTAMGEPRPGGDNIALASMGTNVVGVSSNFANMANVSTWGAANTIDGQMASEWSSNGDGDDAWVMLDFGRMRDIERFGYRSRKMTDGTSIVTSVRLIFDGTTTMGPFDTPDPDERYEFVLSPIRARTVRIEAVTTTGGNTGAKEIQFYEP